MQECSIVAQGNRMNVLGGYGLVEEVFVPSGKVSFDPHSVLSRDGSEEVAGHVEA